MKKFTLILSIDLLMKLLMNLKKKINYQWIY